MGGRGVVFLVVVILVVVLLGVLFLVVAGVLSAPFWPPPMAIL